MPVMGGDCADAGLVVALLGPVEIGRYGTFTGAHDEDRAHLARAVDHFCRAGDLSGQGYAHLFASLACSIRGELGWPDVMGVGARLEQTSLG